MVTRDYNTKRSNSWIKNGIKPTEINKDEFVKVCKESESMAHACSKLGLHFTTFKKYAELYSCYNPQKGNGRKGRTLNKAFTFKTEDILKGKHPSIQTGNVKRRILKEKIKEYKCEKCQLEKWNNLPISLELNHIDGNRFNHLKENLELLCPNCHAQTSTYRGKNKK